MSFPKDSPDGMFLLRKAFHDLGMEEERRITYIFNRINNSQSSFFEKWANRILFEWPAQYGNTPLRPLLGVLILMVVCGFAYGAVLAGSHRGWWWYGAFVSGISMTLGFGYLSYESHVLPDRPFMGVILLAFLIIGLCNWVSAGEREGIRLVEVDANGNEAGEASTPKTLTAAGILTNHPGLPTWLRALLGGLYFSLINALHIGWRDLNVGSWLLRMQPRKFILEGTGWVRTLSGIQSVISIYLIALAVLSYFGRPFG